MRVLTSNPLDPGAIAGLGIGFMIVALLFYLGLIGLMLWISYLLMRTAVKNGVILAFRETGAQLPPHPYAAAPQAPHASQVPHAQPAPAAPLSPQTPPAAQTPPVAPPPNGWPPANG